MDETYTVPSSLGVNDPRLVRQKDRPKRVFLFLQGHPSRLWRELGDALGAEGHRVEKVHFSVADILFWNRAGGQWYCGRPSDFDTWLEQVLEATGTTDVVYYNDRFPYHEAAMRVAQTRGLRAWCIEFGYLRPDWITLEPDGMGARSRLRHAHLDRLARLGSLPDMTPLYKHNFSTEALHEVVFNLVQYFAQPLHPRFRSDRSVNPLLEYLGWLRHLLYAARDRRDVRRIEQAVARDRFPYFLVTLQMEGDYQVRSSAYSGMAAFLDEIMASFTRFAPADRHLLVKAHPLESGLRDWCARVRRLAHVHGLEDRVHFVRGGDLVHFAACAEGLVTLNSTSALESLRLGRPTLALGDPVYDRCGLTHQSGLDKFWTQPEPVDPRRLTAFLKALSLIQVKGSFFHGEGRKQAVAELSARLTETGPRALHRLLGLP